MTEYISKEDAIKAACRGYCHPGVLCPDELPCREQTKFLRELPSIEIVHCRECEFRNNDDGFCTGRGWPCQLVAADEFCSRGKPKE